MHFIKPRVYPEGEIGFGEYDIEFELCLMEAPQKSEPQFSAVMLMLFVPDIKEQMIEVAGDKLGNPVDAL